jgi:hypothetical protein
MNTLEAIYVHPFPADPDFPLAEYRVISGAHKNRSAPSGTADKTTRFQIDTWAYNYSETQAVKAVFDTLFDGYAGTVDGVKIITTNIDLEFDQWESDTKLYRYVCDIAVEHEGA